MVLIGEIAIDFQVMTFNILPGAKGKKVIERLYSELDKELELKKMMSISIEQQQLGYLIKNPLGLRI